MGVVEHISTVKRNACVVFCQVPYMQVWCEQRIGPLHPCYTEVLRIQWAGASVTCAWPIHGLANNFRASCEDQLCIVPSVVLLCAVCVLLTPVCLPHFTKVLSDVWLEIGEGYCCYVHCIRKCSSSSHLIRSLISGKPKMAWNPAHGHFEI